MARPLCFVGSPCFLLAAVRLLPLRRLPILRAIPNLLPSVDTMAAKPPRRGIVCYPRSLVKVINSYWGYVIGGARLSKEAAAGLEACSSRDPFAAMQGLRYLLEGIGSSKKGMSPSEHQLTLRLLDIVEPFIGATPYRKELINQPNEVLDEIAFHIDSKRDLLAFALTCDRMYRVIHPRHFEYRVVRARISSTAVWQHLLDNRALARGVRQLEVLDSRSHESEIVPSHIGQAPALDPLDLHTAREELVLRALGALPTLISFTWSCSRSLMNVDALWNTLVSCSSLAAVEIVDNAVFTSATEALPRQLAVGTFPFAISAAQMQPTHRQASQNTRSLRSVTLRNGLACESVKTPTLERVSNMLMDRCPNLEVSIEASRLHPIS
jgi:hypothetical protein